MTRRDAPRSARRQIRSTRVFELAIALAYVCQNKADGRAALRAACGVVRGFSAYATAQPRTWRGGLQLTRAELRVLHTCVCARLAQSVLNSARAIVEEPSNAPYLAINCAPGWALMRQWHELAPAEAEAAYAAAVAEGALGHGTRRSRALVLADRLRRWLLPAERPARRDVVLAGALVGAAAALAVAVGVSAIRAIARREAG